MASWPCLARPSPMRTMPCAPATRPWRMQAAVQQYAEEVQRTHGVPLHIRVGLNSGEVVVRAIGNDLHMDYSAVGQTTHLAARMEQMAMPGAILLTAGDAAAGRGLGAGQGAGARAREGAAPSRWRSSSWSGPVRCGGACRPPPREDSPASWGGSRSWRRCTRPWSGPGPGTARSSALVGEAGVGKSRLVYECGPLPPHAGLAGPRKRLGVLWQGDALFPGPGPAQALLPCRRAAMTPAPSGPR